MSDFDILKEEVKVQAKRGMERKWPGVLASALVVLLFWGVFVWQSGGRWDAKLWSSWGVPASDPPFGDMYAVSHGWEMTRSGFDVRVIAIPRYNQPLMWPTAWLAFAPLGVSRASLSLFSVAIALVFYLLVCVFLGAGSWLRGVVVGIGSVSPPVLLCIERMNGDIVVFILLLLAVLWTGGSSRLLQASGFALAAFAAMLKLFPVVAIPVLVEKLRRPAVIMALSALAAFAFYALWDLREILRISKDAPQMSAYSYGAKIVAEQLVLIAGKAGVAMSVQMAWLLVAGFVVAGALIVGCWSVRRGAWTGWQLKEKFDARIFEVGAVLFVATFLLLKNFDYRLMFLLFCLPAAFSAGPVLLRTTAWLSVVYLWLAPGWVWWGGYVKSGAGAVLSVLLGAVLIRHLVERLIEPRAPAGIPGETK